MIDRHYTYQCIFQKYMFILSISEDLWNAYICVYVNILMEYIFYLNRWIYV